MIIREMVADDIDNIKRLDYSFKSNKYYKVSKEDGSYKLDIQKLEENYEEKYSIKLMDEEGKYTKTFLIEENERIFGYIEMLYIQHNNLLQIINLWVEEDVRERSIGRKLIKSAKGFARFNKARGIIVQVENYNYPAIKFFIKEGFYICEINESTCGNKDLLKDRVRIDLLFDFK